MAPGPRRSARSNVTKSYKNTCGAPAPRGKIQQPCSTVSVVSKKSVTPKKLGGNLTCTRSGEALSPGAWCSGCRNGGILVICSNCQIISFCTDCILFDMNDQSLEFECPPCFLKKNHKEIYPWTLRAVSTAREHWPKILVNPLAVISIHLEGMNDTPAYLTYHHLQPWLQGNIVHVDLDFNMTDVPHNDWAIRLNSMLDYFETGEFKEWTRFFIFITTHSDPTNGFLHIAPNNGASVPVDEIMGAIITDRFRSILRRSKSNLLSLLSCGALSSSPESRNTIKILGNEGIFEKILCFSQPNFQPSSTHKFVMDWGLNHFVFDRPNIQQFLLEHQAIGAHTDVVQFRPGNIKTFKWTHVGARPLGFGINPQCGCKRLKTKTPKPTEDHSGINYSEVIIRCSVCKAQDVFTIPAGWKWVHSSPSKGDERGAWLVHEEMLMNM